MYNTIEEKCKDCYFWIHSDLPGVLTGTCTRFPRKEVRHQDEGCGEFKPKKVVQILREEEKK